MKRNKISVRYGPSGAPKTAGPRHLSPPRPAERPGAGRVFLGSLPLSPASPVPQTGPCKDRWGETGPRLGMSGDSPRIGAGRGSPRKYPPRPRVTAGLTSGNLPRPVTNSKRNAKQLIRKKIAHSGGRENIFTNNHSLTQRWLLSTSQSRNTGVYISNNTRSPNGPAGTAMLLHARLPILYHYSMADKRKTSSTDHNIRICSLQV